MATLMIDTKQHNGKIFYCFHANQTDYTINQENDGRWCVWSERTNTCFGLKVTVYRDLEELANRSKTLAGFAALVDGPTNSIS